VKCEMIWAIVAKHDREFKEKNMSKSGLKLENKTIIFFLHFDFP